MQFEVYNILTLIDEENGMGEKAVQNLLSHFSCPRSTEIEYFLKNNAIDFSKRRMSITYLVLDENMDLAAYFTLTHKSTKISEDILSKTQYKKLAAHAKMDISGQFDVSAFLIAQLGKNAAVKTSDKLPGSKLIEIILGILENIQQYIGGGVVFLECDPQPSLIKFYQKAPNRFVIYGERDSEEGIKYCQMLRFF